MRHSQEKTNRQKKKIHRIGLADYLGVGLYSRGQQTGLRELVVDREAWRAAIHGVAKSLTRLSD